jgi:signal transduction histidine kinase
VREVVGRFDDELRRSGQSVAIEAEGEVVGRWDRMRIEQIATNLISNAIKYGARRPIEIAIGGDGANALLSVRDHGIGIAEKDRARIFERFERLLSATHTGGFGLGLWIVREIVQALGGTIRVESQVGIGSTFTVDLPKQHVH